LRSPAPIVARLFPARALLLAQRVELFTARITIIGVPRFDELLGGRTIAIEPLHLKIGPVVIEPQPPHAVEYRLHRRLGRALPVGVFDAQDESAAVLPRVGPAEERRACASNVQ